VSERSGILSRLLKSTEPSIRYKVRVNVLGEEPNSPAIRRLRNQIRSSSRVRSLLRERDTEGRIPYHPYAKWYGAHWVLATLADIGYPPGDRKLIPLRERVHDWLLYYHEERVSTIMGRVRRCASQQGNAIYAMLTLGLADARTEELVAQLQRWQWPDGGWNCDRNPTADTSSFMETLIPLRALALHARLKSDPASGQAAKRAAEVFLKRRLFRRQANGNIIQTGFTRLHYPCYWHYDILFGLKVMAEAGFIQDPRCRDALDLLESKRLPDGGFPAEESFYRVRAEPRTGRELVDWGGVSKTRMNEFVTADALGVLRAAGRPLSQEVMGHSPVVRPHRARQARQHDNAEG